jgi:hypothetical protein
VVSAAQCSGVEPMPRFRILRDVLHADGCGETVRRAAKIDANQPAIVKALRALGAFVQPLHTVGDGCPDLLVAFRGQTLLVEVKDGSKPPSARSLTEDQQKWHAEWIGGPLAVVTDVDGAIRAVSTLGG